MEKMTGTSMNIELENIEKIKELFPNAVTEGKIDFDVLRTMLGDEVDASKEKYQFTWNGKAESIKLAQSPSSTTLRPCKEKSKNWDTTENLYIEGDNLEVLKQLQKTYYSKIKMIYIDPPYNTGNDFVYKDNFKGSIENYKEQTNQTQKSNPETSGRFHSDWLNMMYPRLLLARNLLSDDGIIFISIDDNELINLKKICDEIFGDNNYVALLSVENNPKGRKNSKFISVSNEYCLVYARNSSIGYFVENVPKNISDLTMDEEGNYVHNSGKRVLVGENDFNKTVSDYNIEKHYSVYYDATSKEMILKKERSIDEVDETLISKGYNRYYSFSGKNFVENTYTAAKFTELFEEGKLEFKNGKVYEKNMSTTIRLKSLLVNKSYDAVINNVVKPFSMDFKTTSAGTAIKELFGTKDTVFDAPKSTNYLSLLSTLLDGDDFIVLDFFSGSASMAHAIMESNAELEKHRKFIMVQLPETTDEKSAAYKAGFKNICEIGEERIRLAGEKIKADWIENHKQGNLLEEEKDFQTDVGFKVFTLDSTNINPWDNTNEYDEASLFDTATVFKIDRSNEDVLYEVMLKYGVFDQPVSEVKVNGKTMYRVGQRHMIVCLEDKIEDSDIIEICKLEPRVVLFKEDGFKDDNAKINAEYNLKKSGVEDVKCI